MGVIGLQTLIDVGPLKRILLYFEEINVVHLDEGIGDPDLDALYHLLLGQDWCHRTVLDVDEVVPQIENTRAIASNYLGRPISVLEARDGIYLRVAAMRLNEVLRGAVVVPAFSFNDVFDVGFAPMFRVRGATNERSKQNPKTTGFPLDVSMEDCCAVTLHNYPVPSEQVPRGVQRG